MEVKFNPHGMQFLDNMTLIVNCTPHAIKFQHEVSGEVLELPKSGLTLNATGEETVLADEYEYKYVSTVFKASAEGDAELAFLRHVLIESSAIRMIIVGSIVSAQAWPGIVASLIPIKGEERLPPNERHYSLTKFNMF